MEKPRYFDIISAPHFLDKFIDRAFRKAGYAPAPEGDTASPRTSVFIAGGDGKAAVSPAAERLVIIVPLDARKPAISLEIPVTVINAPYIIGTGMTGLMRELVAMVGRGTMFHIDGNDARVSVIHASDVARLAVALADFPGEYTVTDGVNPTWHELLEALSVRVGHKRISTFGPKAAKWLAIFGPIWGGPDRKTIDTITHPATVVTTPLPIEFQPIDTVDYLKNHEYTDEDL